MDEVFNVIFIKNPAAGVQWTTYLYPFTNYSWVALGIFTVAAATILFIVARCLYPCILIFLIATKNEISHFRCGIMDTNINEFTIPKDIVFVISGLTNRGWSVTPTTWKAKIAFTW